MLDTRGISALDFRIRMLLENTLFFWSKLNQPTRVVVVGYRCSDLNAWIKWL